MNRKKRIMFFGLLAIIYILISINFHKIRFAISMLRLYNQEKKSETVVDDKDNSKKVVDNPLKDILSAVDNEDKSVDNEESNAPPVDNKNIDGNSKDYVEKVDKKDKFVEAPDNEDTEEISNTKPYKTIISEYNTILEDLRSTFESELDSLIQNGVKEYKEGSLSSTQLTNKYLSIGANLEKSSDNRFNKVLKEMEKELKSNGYETSIIKEIKIYYTSFKDAKKTDLINKGMKHLD